MFRTLPIIVLSLLLTGCQLIPIDPGAYPADDHIVELIMQARDKNLQLEARREALVELREIAQLDLTRKLIDREIQRVDDQIAFRDQPQPPSPPPVDRPPDGSDCGVTPAPPAGNGGGFVWKPVSESDGRLVILIDRRFRKHVQRLEVWGHERGRLEAGRFVGDTHNGCRPHFRFNRPGRDYGRDLMVRAWMNDGSLREWAISDGARRWDY